MNRAGAKRRVGEAEKGNRAGGGGGERTKERKGKGREWGWSIVKERKTRE